MGNNGCKGCCHREDPDPYGYDHPGRYHGYSNRRNTHAMMDFSQGPSLQNSTVSFFNYMGELRIGHMAPKWTATAVYGNGDMKEISLDDFRGRYLVLFFYPMDFTFVCPTEILSFSNRIEEFKEIDCEVIGASTDTKHSHLAWINTPREKGGLSPLKIPLISDKTCEIAKKYGIYKPDEGISFRGLFIIDAGQKLRQITINDLAVGRSVDETLRLVQAFQHTDKFGELCPANWKPGEGAIKPVSDSMDSEKIVVIKRKKTMGARKTINAPHTNF